MMRKSNIDIAESGNATHSGKMQRCDIPNFLRDN
jgi:hypothetical protein